MERLEEKMREYLLKGQAREERDKRIFIKEQTGEDDVDRYFPKGN